MKKEEKKPIKAIIGFSLSILSVILAVLLNLFAFAIGIGSLGINPDLTSFYRWVVGTFIFIILSFVFSLLGLKEKKCKTFAIIGLVISVLVASYLIFTRLGLY